LDNKLKKFFAFLIFFALVAPIFAQTQDVFDNCVTIYYEDSTWKTAPWEDAGDLVNGSKRYVTARVFIQQNPGADPQIPAGSIIFSAREVLSIHAFPNGLKIAETNDAAPFARTRSFFAQTLSVGPNTFHPTSSRHVLHGSSRAVFLTYPSNEPDYNTLEAQTFIRPDVGPCPGSGTF